GGFGLITQAMHVGEIPHPVDECTVVGDDLANAAVRPQPDDLGPNHFAGKQMITLDEPPSTFEVIVESDLGFPLTFPGGSGFVRLIAGRDFLGVVVALWHQEFTHGEDGQAEDDSYV